MGEVIVGIDLGLRVKHVAAIRSSNGTISPKRVRFAHTRDGLASLWQAVCRSGEAAKIEFVSCWSPLECRGSR